MERQSAIVENIIKDVTNQSITKEVFDELEKEETQTENTASEKDEEEEHRAQQLHRDAQRRQNELLTFLYILEPFLPLLPPSKKNSKKRKQKDKQFLGTSKKKTRKN